jgi:hemerythrin-like domain-containing protein
LSGIESKQKVDPVLVDIVVDFIKVYADRTHHGKEEDIFFREMDKKPLSAEDRKIMNELIDEHVFGRKTTNALAEANKRYKNGEKAALEAIAESFRALLEFYPGHIDKEDKNFFPASRNYLTDEEDKKMVEEFREFDRKLIHEKYESLIKELEG